MTNLYGLQKKRSNLAREWKRCQEELKTCDANERLGLMKKSKLLEDAKTRVNRQIEKARKPRKVFQVINGKGKNR